MTATNPSVSSGAQPHFSQDPMFVKIAELLTNAGIFAFVKSEAGEIVASSPACRIVIESVEDAFILAEVFLSNVYDLRYAGEHVVWDIGMNIGIGSLFFAQQRNVRAIYGFEPFAPTFRQAQRNFSMNPVLAAKITAFNYGVGRTDRDVLAEYCYDRKGSASLHRRDPRRPTDAAMTAERVEIRDACAVLDSVIRDIGERRLVAKLDCEGAEYEIIDRLNEGGRLSSLTAVMVEWHDQGPDRIVATLAEAGFVTVAIGPKHVSEGMVYAVRAPA